MSADFLDTNVIVYFASRDSGKFARAAECVTAGGTVSVQVLNELSLVLRRKFGMNWTDIRTAVGIVTDLLDVVPITVDIHRQGLRLAERYGFAIYDAMIVSAALEAGCTRLWSEDMQHGLVVDDRLTLTNPFA